MQRQNLKFAPSGKGNPETWTEMLPYYLVVNNEFLFHADGTYAKGMELYSCSDDAATDDMLAGRFDLFRRMILSLNPDLTLAVYLKIDPSAAEILRFLDGRKCENPIFNKIHVDKIAALKDRIAKRILRRVKIYVFLHYDPRNSSKEKGLLKEFLKSRKIFKDAAEHLEMDVSNRLRQQAHVFKKILANSEFRLVDMEGEDYAKVIYQHLNPERLLQTTEVPKLNSRPIRDTLCWTDLFIEKDHLEFSGFKTRIISLHELPEHTYPNMISSLLRLRDLKNNLFTNFDITTIISIPDQEKEIHKLKQERVKASGVASDGLKNDIEASVQLTETSELVEKLRATSEKLVMLGAYVKVSSKNQEELDSMTASVVSTLSSMEGITGYVENYGNLPIFLDTLPGYPIEKSRLHKMTATNAAHLLTIHRTFEGSSKYPAIIFDNNAQGVAGYGLNEEKEHDAKHVLVFGQTGSGKSVLVLKTLVDFLVFNPIYRVIDASQMKESSYIKFFQILENNTNTSSFFQIDLEKGITINMFDIESFTPDRLNNLANIIEAMILNPEEKAIDKLRRTELEEDIKILYDKVKKPTLSDFTEICRDEKIKKILRGMWCKGGKYGKLVDGHSTVPLGGKAVGFDLKKLSAFPDLQRVMILMLVDNIWQMVEKYKHEPKVIPMDEAWTLLSTPGPGREMVASFYRTLRGANGVAICISQSLSDFADPAIKENVGTYFVCKPKLSADVLGPIAGELDLNESEINMIKRLERSPGEYNDVFMCQTGNFGKRSGVVRVALSPFELWTYTTDPDDNKQMDKYKKQYPDEPISQILERLAKDYPKGAKI